MDGKVTKDSLIAQVKSEMETQLMQDIYNSITSKCFIKCVSRPADKLDKAEQVCLAKCVDRFVDSRQVVTDTMIDRGSRSGDK
mmetsp:Transcript_27686/g.65936  ORF Transcript_27686/g.65936 Transcript_27686/m.65936 type:complete len:83 (+) Transcript_27686:216-464(+)